MEHPILEWIRATPPGQLVRDVFWMSPALEVSHFIGTALLIGVVVMIDLRVLGCAPALPITRLRRFLPWALAGFAINLVSGTLFFAADPEAFAFNPAFRLKLLCIALAGANALWFHALAVTRGSQWDQYGTPWAAKLASLLSLLSWLAVITCGRLIPFTPNVS